MLHAFYVINTPSLSLVPTVMQLPDLSSLGWLSAVGALMSVTYSVGGAALSLNSALPRDQVHVGVPLLCELLNVGECYF